MLVEIKGVQFDNRGAHLMLLTVLERLRVRYPAVRAVLRSGPSVSAAQRATVAAWCKLNMRKRWVDLNGLSYVWPDVIDAGLNRRGLVAEGQLDAILDASGFAYGKPWTPWLMAYAADEVERFERHGKRYVFLPQAFGPYEGTADARDFGAALERASLVFVRDRRSQAYLEQLNPRLTGRLERYPDITIDAPGDLSAAQSWGVDRCTVLLIPNSNMLSAANPDATWRSGYVDFLRQVQAQLRARDCKVMLLNHGGPQDAVLCRQLADTDVSLEVIDEVDPRRTKGVIGAAGAVLSSRYHGCVAALSQSVPCLGTSWSHKYRELFDEFGVEGDLLRDCDARIAAERLASMVEARSAYASVLAKRVQTMVARLETMWQQVFAVLPPDSCTGSCP